MRVARVVLMMIALVVVALGPHGAIVAVKTLALLPEIFPEAPIHPLRWLTPPPSVERRVVAYPGGEGRVDIYTPGALEPTGAVILVLGARPVDQDDPVVAHFAEGMSRAGAVVMVPASDGLAAGQINTDEADLLVRATLDLAQRPDVAGKRLGYVGLSVGGSLALLAAADARISSQVTFVNAFGAYFDARDLVIATASHSLDYAGVAEPWTPAPLTQEVLLNNLLQGIGSETERERLMQAIHDGSDELSPELSQQSRGILALVRGTTADNAREIVSHLPPAQLQRLDAISPRTIMNRLRTDVLVMHDLQDHFIPYTESRRLVEALPREQLRAWTELQIFEHVMPRTDISGPDFFIELVKLYRHTYATCLQFL